MTRRRLWLFRGLAVLGSVAFAVGLIELLPRTGAVKSSALLRRLPTKENSVPVLPETTFDSELIYRYLPNLRRFDPKAGGDNLLAVQQRFGMPPFAFRLETDAEGFLNPDLPKPIDEITSCDAAIIGDSFAVCTRLYDETPFETSIRRQLPNGDSRLILNYGLAGFGPQQELRVLKNYALPKNPRYVVWAFFEGNDSLDAQTFEQRLAEAKKQNSSSVVAAIFQVVLDKKDEDEMVRELSRWYGLMPDNSKVWFHSYGIDFGTGDGDGWPIVRSCLAEAGQLCEQRGIPLLILYIPSKFRVYREFMTIPPDSRCQNWVPNDLRDRVHDLCRELNIDFRDCFDALRNSVAEGTDTYYRNDSHWNEKGSAIGARIAAEWLAEQSARRR